MDAEENITDKQLKKEVGGGKLYTLEEWIDILNTQTSHIKNGICTLKNQYFSP